MTDVDGGGAEPAQTASHLLAVDSRRDGPTHLVAVGGELDISCADVLERTLMDVERTDAERILLDLSGLEFIDSSGLRVVLAAAERSPAGRLTVRPGDGAVRRTLTVTGVDSLLDLAD